MTCLIFTLDHLVTSDSWGLNSLRQQKERKAKLSLLNYKANQTISRAGAERRKSFQQVRKKSFIK